MQPTTHRPQCIHAFSFLVGSLHSWKFKVIERNRWMSNTFKLPRLVSLPLSRSLLLSVSPSLLTRSLFVWAEKVNFSSKTHSSSLSLNGKQPNSKTHFDAHQMEHFLLLLFFLFFWWVGNWTEHLIASMENFFIFKVTEFRFRLSIFFESKPKHATHTLTLEPPPPPPPSPPSMARTFQTNGDET